MDLSLERQGFTHCTVHTRERKKKKKATDLFFQTINTFTTNTPMLPCGGHLVFTKIYGCENVHDTLLSKAHSLSTNQDIEESTSCNEELEGGNTKGTANRVKHSCISPDEPGYQFSLIFLRNDW